MFSFILSIVTEKMLVFSVTILVFHQNDAFLLIVTEKPADFCGTFQKPIDTYNDKQNASPERLTFCHAVTRYHDIAICKSESKLTLRMTVYRLPDI